jgi:hypothetical protein
VPDRPDDAAHLRHHREQAQDTQDAQGTQDREPVRRGQPGDRDNQEIEDIPAGTEKAGTVDIELCGDLDREDEQDDRVDDLQQAAEPLHRGRARLETESDGIQEDKRRDRDREAIAFQECCEASVLSGQAAGSGEG